MNNNRPWLDIYPNGAPANIDADKYPTVIHYMKEVCKRLSKRPAFGSMGVTMTYKELDEMSTNFAAYLHSRGLEPGDRMAIMMPNILQYPVALFGLLKAGVIVVNTNPLYTAREMEHQFNDSEVKAIVIVENFAHNLEKILSKTKIKTIILTSIGEMLGGFKGKMVNFVLKNVKRMVPKYNLPNTIMMKQAIKEGKKFEINAFESHPESVIVHQYTGGTTGVSKGAMLTNRNLVANMLQIKAFINPYLEGIEAPVILAPLPLYHIFAFTVNCLAGMDMGAMTVLIVNPRDLKSVVKEFERYTVHGMTGVNTLYNALLNDEGFRNTNWKSMTMVAAGGTALQKDVSDRWEELTGAQISEGYGMTEASPVVTSNPYKRTRVGTAGIPVPSTDVRIVDDKGEALAQGEVGEIQVKGPQVMKGYYKRPEETANTITPDGWLNTGDIGKLDKEGYLSIVDRKKDMILVSGFNVYPNEIEDVVCMHSKVLECAAIGVASEKSGEAVKIFVVKKDKSLKEDELINHCKQNLTGYKVPKQIVFTEELPKSNVGKILRRKLKE